MSKANAMLTSIRGWDALNIDSPEMDAARKEQGEAIRAINSDMRELFMDSELGTRVLKILIDWTIRQPTARPEATPQMAFFREGQNDIVRSILMACHNSEES